jgi:hypothetical protein
LAKIKYPLQAKYSKRLPKFLAMSSPHLLIAIKCRSNFTKQLTRDYYSFQENPTTSGWWICLHRKWKWILENLTDKDHIRGAFKAVS